MRIIIPSAGDCTRLPDSPYGCKSLNVLAGRRIIDWQLGSFPDGTDVTVVVKNEASRQFRDLPVEVVVHKGALGTDGHWHADGPVRAVSAALDASDSTEPFTVVFSDTLFDPLPARTDEYIGIGLARGGRPWDLTATDRKVYRRDLPDWMWQAVHVGVYRFADLEKWDWLAHRRGLHKWHNLVGDWQFAQQEPIDGWMDVGDTESFARAEKAIHDG